MPEIRVGTPVKKKKMLALSEFMILVNDHSLSVLIGLLQQLKGFKKNQLQVEWTTAIISNNYHIIGTVKECKVFYWSYL